MPFGIVDAPVVADRRADDHEVARQRSAATRSCTPRAGPRRCLPAATPRRARPKLGAELARSRRRSRRAATRSWRRRCGGGTARPRARGVEPGGDAARGELRVLVALHGGVEAPALGARLRVEREHAAERRRQHQQTVDQDRRGLEGHVIGRRRHRRRDRRCGSARRPRAAPRCRGRSGRAASSAGRRRRRRRTASRPAARGAARRAASSGGERTTIEAVSCGLSSGAKLATIAAQHFSRTVSSSGSSSGSGSPKRWRREPGHRSRLMKRAATAGVADVAKWPPARASRRSASSARRSSRRAPRK